MQITTTFYNGSETAINNESMTSGTCYIYVDTGKKPIKQQYSLLDGAQFLGNFFFTYLKLKRGLPRGGIM